MRSSEISISNLFSPQSYNNLLNIFVNQSDGLIWNTIDKFGMFYKMSLPFIVIGGVKILSITVKSIQERVFDNKVFIFLGMMSSLVTCLLVANLNVNKSNSLHFFTLILLTLGIKEIFVIFKDHLIIRQSILCGYILSFALFFLFYFGGYNGQISSTFRYGLQGAVEYVKENNLNNICVDKSAYYPQILFYDETPTDVFIDTVKYSNYPSAFLDVESFGKYKFGIDYNNLQAGETYIAKYDTENIFIDSNYKVVNFGEYLVAFKSK